MEDKTVETTAIPAKFDEVMNRPAVRALDGISALARYQGKDYITQEGVDKLAALLHAEVDKMAEELMKKPLKPGTRVISLV